MQTYICIYIYMKLLMTNGVYFMIFKCMRLSGCDA